MFERLRHREPMAIAPTTHGGIWRVMVFGIIGAAVPIVVIGTLYWIRLAESGFPPKDVSQDIETFPRVVLLPSVMCAIVFALAAQLAWDPVRNRDVVRTLIVIASVTALVAWLTIPGPRSKGDSEGAWRGMLVFTGPIAGYLLARIFVRQERFRLSATTMNAAQQSHPQEPAAGPESNGESSPPARRCVTVLSG